jgi:hypothetical protein
MSKRSELVKRTDDEFRFRCGTGVGILREEVWVDGNNRIARYNLAFLVPHLTSRDNGRILGFDNAHDFHERHFMSEVSIVPFRGYRRTAERFYREVEAIRRQL